MNIQKDRNLFSFGVFVPIHLFKTKTPALQKIFLERKGKIFESAVL